MATDRYGVGQAPGGLALVQDLLNTIPAGRPREPDLLADVATADGWLARALESWALSADAPRPVVALSEGDLEEVRALRSDLHTVLRAPAADPVTLRSVTLGAQLRGDGTVAIEPRGEGWRRLASAVLLEIFAAQTTGQWRRLKLCRNERCAVAFFDRSRNNSGVWHDVHVCGNMANLRAARARRRERATGAG
jgi:predicted RNA-binding Zn ribbon-like protein